MTTTIQHTRVPTATETRTRMYIDVGLDVYRLICDARREDDRHLVAILSAAMTDIDRGLQLSTKEPQEAVFYLGQAYHAMDRASNLKAKRAIERVVAEFSDMMTGRVEA